MTEVEKQVLESTFPDRIREHRFDAPAYEELKKLLVALAAEWLHRTEVSKVVARELLLIPSMVRGAASRLKEPEEARRVYDAADELETLAYDCLSSDE